MFVGTMRLPIGISRYEVYDGVAEAKGALAMELGVVLRLRDCLPSRPLFLPFLIAGGILGLVGSELIGRSESRELGNGSLGPLRQGVNSRCGEWWVEWAP